MYWPTGTARRLHISPAGLSNGPGGQEKDDADRAAEIVDMKRSLNGDLWATCSADTLTVWSVRPSQILAALVRTPKSIEEYGANVHVHWNTDGLGLVVETDASFLLLYGLRHLSQRQQQVYSYVPSNGSGARSRATKEVLAPSLSNLRTTFAPSSGEGASVGNSGRFAIDIYFKLVLRIDAGLASLAATDDYLIVSTRSPPAVQCIPWPQDPSLATETQPSARPQTRTCLLRRLHWLTQVQQIEREDEKRGVEPVYVVKMVYSHEMDFFVWLTSDGRAYCAHVEMDSRTAIWRGRCFHGAPYRRRQSSLAYLPTDPEKETNKDAPSFTEFEPARCVAINANFSLLAVGQVDGVVSVYTFRSIDKAALFSHNLSVRSALRSTASYLQTGACISMAWTRDGHALAVAWQNGWSVWSTFGKLMSCSLTDNWQDASRKFADTFMKGCRSLFWGPGNTDLFLLSAREKQTEPFDPDKQLFVLPFAKSALASQHLPDNTRYAFVQLDDSVLVYRGSDQPDMSIINPESDVWHQIKIPQSYLAANWPVRYASISSDGRLIAIAGRRGLTHFSSLSGRWKQFQQPQHEQRFRVVGGLQWYQHVLVAACHIPDREEYQIRLYSRDLNLDEASVLYTEYMESAVVLTSLFDNSLLVYTADNTLHHYLIAITDAEIRLTLCGSITFEGVVGEPSRVRGMSWLVPPNQQRFGDPMEDLMVATIIFLIDGKLVLLRPRRSSNADDEEEVSYDMQILGDRVEFYWTHLQGVGTLENSLWGYDGNGIKLWLDALTIEQADVIKDSEEGDDERPEYRTIEESLAIPLDFYPLCVLIEKGIVIGVEPEVSLRRSLDFAIFRSTTNTQLFVQHVLRNYLFRRQMDEAVLFASFYRPLVYFAHALEIFLHDVLEDEADSTDNPSLSASNSQQDESIVEHIPKSFSSDLSLASQASNPSSAAGAGKSERTSTAPPKALLPLVVAFLDHFDECLDVVVNCARKTEVARWNYLFSFVGDPRELFEVCLAKGNYKAAGSYLLVLHNLETIEESRQHTVRLLKLARRDGWHNLCKDLLRFTRSLDDDGQSLRMVITEANLTEEEGDVVKDRAPVTPTKSPLNSASMQRTSSAPTLYEAVIMEEDESTPDGSPSMPTDFQDSSKRVPVQRSTSLFNSSVRNIPPPLPRLDVNGRIMPSNQLR